MGLLFMPVLLPPLHSPPAGQEFTQLSGGSQTQCGSS